MITVHYENSKKYCLMKIELSTLRQVCLTWRRKKRNYLQRNWSVHKKSDRSQRYRVVHKESSLSTRYWSIHRDAGSSTKIQIYPQDAGLSTGMQDRPQRFRSPLLWLVRIMWMFLNWTQYYLCLSISVWEY